MRTAVLDMAIRWLAAPEPEPLCLAPRCSTLPRTPAPFDEGAGDGWMEMLDLDLGVHLCRVVHRFAPGQGGLRPMSAVHAELAEPIFFVQSTRVGAGVLDDQRVGLRLAHDPRSCVFAHLDRVDHQHLAEADGMLEVTALSVERSRLEGLLGAAAAQDLLLALAIASAPAASVRPVPPHIKTVLEAALTDALTGGLRRLHAQARVLDFLVALAGQLHTLPCPEANRRARLRRVREELDQLQGQVPNLAELAGRHGFSARALNQGFKEAFGKTVFAYVADRRLDAAHALLRTSRVPLKVVAARLGYASVSHFSRAFTGKFGVRPGSIRPRPGDNGQTMEAGPDAG
jgi:AraC-like DNA-binding protein